MSLNGPYDTYTDSPILWQEREHTVTTYGEPYVNTIDWQSYKLKTVAVIKRYHIRFLSASAADACVTALVASYAAEGSALTPPRTVATVKAVRAYDIEAYDVEVDYCNATVTEIYATGS